MPFKKGTSGNPWEDERFGKQRTTKIINSRP